MLPQRSQLAWHAQCIQLTDDCNPRAGPVELQHRLRLDQNAGRQQWHFHDLAVFKRFIFSNTSSYCYWLWFNRSFNLFWQ